MSEFIGDEYEVEGGQGVIDFASEIEQAAAYYESDYESGVIDAFAVRRNTMDVVGETESRFMLSVDRMYICDDVVLDAPVSEYTISTETIRHGLDITAFPSEVWERLKSEFPADDEDEEAGYQYSEEWLDELHDDETEFAVGYRYQHTLRSDGVLFPECSMVVYVNDTEVQLADYRLDEFEGGSVDTSDSCEVSSVPMEFEKLFSAEEKNFLQEVGRQALAEFRPTKVIDNLYDWMQEIRFRSTDMRIESMRAILRQEMPYFMQEIK